MKDISSYWLFIRRHKYWVTIILFAVIIIFLDDNSLIIRWKQQYQIRSLEKEIEKYQKEFDESTLMLKKLTDDPEAIEKIAREKYFMKKPNEDIYVFEDSVE